MDPDSACAGLTCPGLRRFLSCLAICSRSCWTFSSGAAHSPLIAAWPLLSSPGERGPAYCPTLSWAEWTQLGRECPPEGSGEPGLVTLAAL